MWTKDFVSCLEESTAGYPRVDEAIAIKEQHLPKRIYKYRCDTDYARDCLKTDTVWMASPESYNDPYDCSLTFPLDTLLALLEARMVDPFIKAAKLEGLISAGEIESAKKSSKPLNTIVQHMRLLSSPEARHYWGGKAESYSAELVAHAQGTVAQIEGFRKRAKVCSFSAVNDSLLMWSHYANHHKGICIEYNLEALGADHSFRKNLYPVLYSKDFYDLLPFMQGLTGGSRQEYRLMIPLVAMLHKFDGWEYEKEWRLMSETENIVEDHPQPAPVPSRIFLGARFEPSTGKHLLAICREKGIPISRMGLAKGKFALSSEDFQE
jgi:hypothetical protein